MNVALQLVGSWTNPGELYAVIQFPFCRWITSARSGEGGGVAAVCNPLHQQQPAVSSGSIDFFFFNLQKKKRCNYL